MLRALTPYGIVRNWDRRANKASGTAPPADNPERLFDGADALFKSLVGSASVYGEYGCGKSSQWALKNSSAQVLSVDTSLDWIEKVRSQTMEYAHRLQIKHVDLGEMGAWGWPLRYRYRDRFWEYTDFLWQQTKLPDVVLVDGRFRVCCFLTSLKYARPGTKILFDDYINRPHYHIVESYVPRVEVWGRQCLFVAPPADSLDMQALDREIANFRHVLD